jgi:hypothetical protein
VNCEALRLAREKYAEIAETTKNRGITHPRMNRPKIVKPRLGDEFIMSQGK